MKDKIRRVARSFQNYGYQVASWEPLLSSIRARKLRNGIVVLMYHEIAEDSSDIEAWTVIKKNDFIRQMQYLKDFFEIISLDEAFNRICDSKKVVKPTVVITFDDGYIGNRRILLPILKSMDIPVTIFVATESTKNQTLYWYDQLINELQERNCIQIHTGKNSPWTLQLKEYRGVDKWREISKILEELKELSPEKRRAVMQHIEPSSPGTSLNTYRLTPLTISDLQELASNDLITIGAHSHCHNILPQLSDREIEESILQSKVLLEQWLDRPITFFSYPNGDYNDNIVEMLIKLGFRCSFTTIPNIWRQKDSFYTIPRVGIGRYDTISFFKMKVSGLFSD